MINREWHRRLHRHETFDRIELVVVPRYKTSGISGDEWRTSVTVRLWFKGVCVAEEGYRDMEAAVARLLPLMDDKSCPVSSEWIAAEERSCSQPGCSEPATARFRLKRLTSPQGDFLDMSDQHSVMFRQFCDRHAQRGDCSREDCDSNYERVSL